VHLPRHGGKRLRAAQGVRADGDERWLERARRFAVHVLEQVETGPGRFSLFTGDLGVALFAADCVAGTASYPIVDAW
jgi:hypothetical protein